MPRHILLPELLEKMERMFGKLNSDPAVAF
jgi:hypothetical protein